MKRNYKIIQYLGYMAFPKAWKVYLKEIDVVRNPHDVFNQPPIHRVPVEINNEFIRNLLARVNMPIKETQFITSTWLAFGCDVLPHTDDSRSRYVYFETVAEGLTLNMANTHSEYTTAHPERGDLYVFDGTKLHWTTKNNNKPCRVLIFEV